jgi:CBS domain-containing protein
VEELIDQDWAMVTQQEPLSAAIARMGRRRARELVVVDQDNPQRVVGLLTQADILRAYWLEHLGPDQES